VLAAVLECALDASDEALVHLEQGRAGEAAVLLVTRLRLRALALPKRRETSAQWQRAAELLLAEDDIGAFSRQVELALFYDAKLDVSKSLAK